MRHIRLIAREDRSGFTGLFVQGMNYAELDVATSGEMLAHDIIEHVNGKDEIGSIEDELQALGALWALRARHGELRRGEVMWVTPEEAIGHDLSAMATEVYFGAYIPPKIPRTYAHYFDESFEIILAEGQELFERELRYMQDDDGDTKQLEHYWNMVISNMRIGARKLKRQHGSFEAAARKFWNIREAAHRYIDANYSGFETYRLSFDENNAYMEEVF